MNLLSNTFAPINGITSAFNGKHDSLGGVVGGKGCPAKGKCIGCTAFCCANGEESQLNIKNVNDGSSLYQGVIAAISVLLSACFPPLGLAFTAAMAVEEYVLKPCVNYINSAMNKGTQAAFAVAQGERHMRAAVNMIVAMLQTRIPWCDVVKRIESNFIFAKNSPWFGNKGPEVGKEFLTLYMTAANELNNMRFGKTKQKILEVGQTIKSGEIAEINFREHTLQIRVSNIEHYWMGDIVSLPGMMTPVTLMHRWGKSKIYSSDCDRVFVDERVYPSDNHGHGRGCPISYSAASLTMNLKNVAGSYEGLNIRNLMGEGWLFFDVTYKDSHQSMKGQYLDLDNPIYINPEGQVIIPAASTTKNNTPVAATTIAAATMPVQTASFPVTAISVVAFVGIAAGFLYQSFKND